VHDELKTLYVRNRDDWRSWLQKHSTASDEVWLLYYKKNARKPSVP